MKIRFADLVPIVGALRMSRRLEKMEARLEHSIIEKDFLIQAYEARLNGIYKNLLELSMRADEHGIASVFRKAGADGFAKANEAASAEPRERINSAR